MGAETAAYTLAAISAGATIGKISAEKQAEQAQLSALNAQSKLTALQYQEKHLQNLDTIDKIINRQAAQFATRGVTFDSPSFNAIQRETINIGSKKESALQTEESLAQRGIEIEKKNAKATLHSQLFGDAANFAFNAVSLIGKLPSVEDI